MITAKSENSRNSNGSLVRPSGHQRLIEQMPLRPRKGIQEIMRMMLEVQNGTVQSRNSAICHRNAAHMEHQEIRYA